MADGKHDGIIYTVGKPKITIGGIEVDMNDPMQEEVVRRVQEEFGPHSLLLGSSLRQFGTGMGSILGKTFMQYDPGVREEHVRGVFIRGLQESEQRKVQEETTQKQTNSFDSMRDQWARKVQESYMKSLRGLDDRNRQHQMRQEMYEKEGQHNKYVANRAAELLGEGVDVLLVVDRADHGEYMMLAIRDALLHALDEEEWDEAVYLGGPPHDRTIYLDKQYKCSTIIRQMVCRKPGMRDLRVLVDFTTHLILAAQGLPVTEVDDVRRLYQYAELLNRAQSYQEF